MPELFLSVIRMTNTSPAVDCIGGGYWLEHGAATIDETTLNPQDAVFVTQRPRNPETGAAVFFGVHQTAPNPDTPGLLACEAVQIDHSGALIRLDQVSFPPGAIAYRHIHPGPGFRYLADGALQIISDHHEEAATPGHIWFEPANSPVRAEASPDHNLTRFLRLMLLPVECEGKPTINILDPADREKPRLQTTHRFFDQRVDLGHSG